MHFLVRTETEFNLFRHEVDEPYSQEEIKVMKRLWKNMHHITEGSRGKKEKE